MGQPSLAASAACRKASSSMPSTLPWTVRALDTTLKPPSTLSNVTVALTRNCCGGVPALPRPAESAIEKQLAWAAAINSSGLVRPSGCSVRAGQLTPRSANAWLVVAVTTPLPDGRSPVQVASARLTAAMNLSCVLPDVLRVSFRGQLYHQRSWAAAGIERGSYRSSERRCVDTLKATAYHSFGSRGGLCGRSRVALTPVGSFGTTCDYDRNTQANTAVQHPR